MSRARKGRQKAKPRKKKKKKRKKKKRKEGAKQNRENIWLLLRTYTAYPA
jgi:hypothetical protein